MATAFQINAFYVPGFQVDAIAGSAAQSVVVAQVAIGTTVSGIIASADQTVTVIQSASAAAIIQGASATNVSVTQTAAGTIAIAGTQTANVIVAQIATGHAEQPEITGDAGQIILINQTAIGSVAWPANVITFEPRRSTQITKAKSLLSTQLITKTGS